MFFVFFHFNNHRKQKARNIIHGRFILGKEVFEDVTYVQLDNEAAQIPLGSGGLIAIETFQGSRTPGKIRPIEYI